MPPFPVEEVLTPDPEMFASVRQKLSEIGYTISITGDGESPVVDLLKQQLN